MRQTLTTLKFLIVIALGVFAVSCASETQEKQNLAIAAGFKIITPKNAEQQGILAKLAGWSSDQGQLQGEDLFRSARTCRTTRHMSVELSSFKPTSNSGWPTS